MPPSVVVGVVSGVGIALESVVLGVDVVVWETIVVTSVVVSGTVLSGGIEGVEMLLGRAGTVTGLVVTGGIVAVGPARFQVFPDCGGYLLWVFQL